MMKGYGARCGRAREHSVKNRNLWPFLLPFILLLPLFVALAQTNVTAEALQFANLRALPNPDAAKVGEISAGTAYPVLSRYFSWLLLGDATTQAPLGWVFVEIVRVNGDINTVPLLDDAALRSVVIGGSATLVPTATFSTDPNAPTVAPTSVPIQPPNSIAGTAQGEINIRSGPGVEYPRLGVARAGDVFAVTGYHTQFPWIQIQYASSPSGFGWVQQGLLVLTGDIFSTSAISQTRFELPALTATPPQVVAAGVFNATPAPLNPQFQALGDQLWSMILAGGFDPQTSTLGALYLLDLRTGEAVMFGNNFAFSGMSINKISILAALYQQLDNPPTPEEAQIIVNTMICSENTSTNQMIALVGDGDMLLGTQRITEFMRQAGMSNSFMLAPFRITADSTPVPVIAQTTFVDQTRAQPDIANQMTVNDMGSLLGSIYQCGYQETGPLLTQFPGQFTPSECRQMLHAMSYNKIGEFIEAGTPTDVRIAHKHGWVNETHGDAGIVFSNGGDYALVVVLHSPTWLSFDLSAPLIAGVSRTVYNYYNPSAPMPQINQQVVPQVCTPPLNMLSELQQLDYNDPLRPVIRNAPTLAPTVEATFTLAPTITPTP
jgi:uncharacterized protein YraI/beta-lactamase class A